MGMTGTPISYSTAEVSEGGQHPYRASVVVKDGVMHLRRLDQDVVQQIPVVSAWVEGQNRWGLTDAEGVNWQVRRLGGCGCRG